MTRDSVFNLLALLFPLVVGYLTRWIMTGLKRLSGAVDAAPAWVKQVSVVVIAAVLSALGIWTGVDFGSSLGGVTETAITALLSAVFAMVTHNGAKLANLEKYGTFQKPHAAKTNDPGKYGSAAILICLLGGMLAFTACEARVDRSDSATMARRDSAYVDSVRRVTDSLRRADSPRTVP